MIVGNEPMLKNRREKLNAIRIIGNWKEGVIVTDSSMLDSLIIIYPNNIWVKSTSIKETVTSVITTAPVVLVPTSFGPPFVVSPHPQEMIAICKPKITDLIIIEVKSVSVRLTLPDRTEDQKIIGGTL